jgi:hypothetical protein
MGVHVSGRQCLLDMPFKVEGYIEMNSKTLIAG